MEAFTAVNKNYFRKAQSSQAYFNVAPLAHKMSVVLCFSFFVCVCVCFSFFFWCVCVCVFFVVFRFVSRHGKSFLRRIIKPQNNSI